MNGARLLINSSRVILPRASVCSSRVLIGQYGRLNSTKSSSSNDEDVDEWLTAVKNLRTQFSNPATPFDPETSLAPPGQLAINKTADIHGFAPTESQLEEVKLLTTRAIPLPKDELVENCVNLMMNHGKKARAQKSLARALFIVRLQLRIDPVDVLHEVMEKMAPLVSTHKFKNRTAKADVIPITVNKRQGVRYAFNWILEGAAKRQASNFSVRLGEELIAAYQGNSSGFEKRSRMHKEAISFRSFLRI